MTQHRQPPGIPVGGQFAADAKPRSGVSLAGADSSRCPGCGEPLENGACSYAEMDAMEGVDHETGQELTPNPAEVVASAASPGGPNRFGTTTSVSEPVAITPRSVGRMGQWEISSPISDNPEDLNLMSRLQASISGAPAERRVRNAAAAELIRASEDPETVANKLNSLADMRGAMTVLCTSADGTITALEGRGHRSPDGRTMLMAKGSSTYSWPVGGKDGLDVVAVVPAYGGQQSMADAFAANLAKVPATEPTHFEGVPSYSYSTDPEGAGPPSAVTAVYLYNHPGFGSGGESRTVGCMFMATDYDAENDIVNGYGWVPRGSGLVSEHGSMYGRDLQSWGGRVSGYEPGSITFGDMLERRVPRDRGEAYRAVQGQPFYNE